MPTKSSKTSGPIYQLKIALRNSHPPIWRRVLVPGNFNLYQLHQVIQVAMGWSNSHLHHIRVGTVYYSYHPYSNSGEMDEEDSRNVTLAQIAPDVKRKLMYEYDFGDSWEHDILVEKIFPPEPTEKYPQCVKGKGACPPEDVGGVWGYATFLEAIHDPKHEEHDMYVEWAGGDFDPEAFDLEVTNRVLQQMKYLGK